jgi:hypothetical protein
MVLFHFAPLDVVEPLSSKQQSIHRLTGYRFAEWNATALNYEEPFEVTMRRMGKICAG